MCLWFECGPAQNNNNIFRTVRYFASGFIVGCCYCCCDSHSSNHSVPSEYISLGVWLVELVVDIFVLYGVGGIQFTMVFFFAIWRNHIKLRFIFSCNQIYYMYVCACMFTAFNKTDIPNQKCYFGFWISLMTNTISISPRKDRAILSMTRGVSVIEWLVCLNCECELHAHMMHVRNKHNAKSAKIKSKEEVVFAVRASITKWHMKQTKANTNNTQNEKKHYQWK